MADAIRKGEGGFTLVEVLVAFAILAVALGFLMHVIANVVGRTGEAASRAGALEVGQSLLDRLGVDLPLQDGVSEGDGGSRYRWHIEISPYGDEEDRQNWPAAAHRVAVTVFWDNGGGLTLSTLKLGPKEDVH